MNKKPFCLSLPFPGEISPPKSWLAKAWESRQNAALMGPGYQQLTLHTTPSEARSLSEIALELGALSASIQDADDGTTQEQPIYHQPEHAKAELWQNCHITLLLNADTDSGAFVKQIEDALPGPPLSYQVELIPDKDWLAEDQKRMQPVTIGDRLTICPSHLTGQIFKNTTVILDPGLAFGTGTHPTTALCLEWLTRQELKSKQILDFGCGSGILAIAALKLGAQSCVATDIDPQALVACNQNALKNNVSLQIQDAASPLPNNYDVTLANILLEPLEKLAPLLCRATRPGGNLILSGFLKEQATPLIKTYAPWIHFAPLELQNGWGLLAGTRKESNL